MTMTIPFLSYFKKVKDQVLPKKPVPVPEPAPATPLEKPSSERFSKTVMPNSTRTLSPQDTLETALPPANAEGSTPPSLTPPVPSTPRTISFGAPAAAPRPRDLPPAVALALEPRVERVIALELSDIARHIPAEYIKPLESIDGTRRVLLKASEIEKGMAAGKPAVSLATVYQQVPEIFLRTISPSDDAQVQLPFDKVLNQFNTLQVRTDQERQRAVPQVETPFLKATLEDNTRFGTTTEPGAEDFDSQPGRSDLPPVRIELATAEAYAAAEPEANAFVLKPTGEGTSAPPTRIPLKLSPNGTGGPAPESVPASRGPSVPTSESEPRRIPFKMESPPTEPTHVDEPWLTSQSVTEAPAKEAQTTPEPTPVAAATDAGSSVKITLALKPILQALPPCQLAGDPGTVSETAVIELPFILVEPQLATGRIALGPSAFAAALPAEYKSIFKLGDERAEVLLPLQDVLKNLPVTSLQIRADQVQQDVGADFATPFSTQAAEDAKRFGTPRASVSSQSITPPKVEVDPTPRVAAPREAFNLRPVASVEPKIEEDTKLDARAVVAELNNLAGVKSCALMFGDGLSLAGNLPTEYQADGLCAMGPSFTQRIKNHLGETKLGVLKSMTIACTDGTISFFVHENLCLAVSHSSEDLTADVRNQIAQAVHNLSQKYSHPV